MKLTAQLSKELGIGFRNLERQVGQLATSLSERIPGTLPADTERNPKETVNVVTLISGQVLNDLTPIQKDVEHEKESGEQVKIDVDKKKKEALSQMPANAKFLKEILTKKRKIEETSVVKLTEHCSAILQNKLPQKCGDPETGEYDCREKVSTNIFAAGRPNDFDTRGDSKDVLVRVDKFVFPVDFIVVNMEKNKEVPLTLGKLFLATGRAILDIHERKLMRRVGEETVTFKMNVAAGVRK
ncbi:PREDICTED: uncharacterized protein LOC109234831 [Nicotiana attenuata]|uniref:uncharacterized protein LOC109234831 n=1 Tax=Nicotiana attenuata TaxID=49451 RepID=UPI0009048060|nr:PREDICTED: uncharacterized protein LOC109234831 [Nicotiana attenuata]